MLWMNKLRDNVRSPFVLYYLFHTNTFGFSDVFRSGDYFQILVWKLRKYLSDIVLVDSAVAV